MDEPSVFNKVVNSIKDVADIVGDVNTRIKGGGDIESQIQRLSEVTRTILANGVAMVQLESSMRDKARMLEEKLNEMENWEKEKKLYELKNIPGRGRAFAYVLKASEKSSADKCLFCPTCFENKKKRVLQPTIARTLECSECGMNIYA